MELVLKNPTFSNKELYDHFHSIESIQSGDYFVRIVKGYTYYVSRKIEKYYSFLFKKRLLYQELIQKDKAFLREIDSILNALYIVELSTNKPSFDSKEVRKKIAEILDEPNGGLVYETFRQLSELHTTSPIADEFVATPPSTSSSPNPPR